MLPILPRFFRDAGATGRVFFLRNGENPIDKNLAYSGFVGPKTTIAVVPTTSQIIDFAIKAQTMDMQNVVVQGSLMATFVPAVAVLKFDFTVNPENGSYVSEWEQVLKTKIIQHVMRAVLSKVGGLNVKEATRSQSKIEEAVTTSLSKDALSTNGITVESCSIQKIEPADREVEGAIGASERQNMLTEADKALHGRRLKAAENERAVKEYEAETNLELEKKQGTLLDEQAKNRKKEASADAEATGIRLAPLKDVEAGKLLGAAIMDAARTGQLKNLTITSEFLAAANQK